MNQREYETTVTQWKAWREAGAAKKSMKHMQTHERQTRSHAKTQAACAMLPLFLSLMQL